MQHTTLVLAGLSDLPTELILKIFAALDFVDLVKCRQLSKRFDAIIQIARNLVYGKQLVYNGLVDPSGVPLPTEDDGAHDRLTIIQKYQSVWETLDIARVKSGVAEPRDIVVYGRNVVGHIHHTHASFVKLPSTIRPGKLSSWSFDLNHSVDEAVLNEDQNLLILIRSPNRRNGFTTSIEFCALDTGVPHPLAKSPQVLYSLPREQFVDECVVYLDYLSIRFSHWPSRRICIWNWKTGKLCFTLEGEMITGYAFLSEHHIALATYGRAPILHVLDLRFTPEVANLNTLHNVNHICTFSLPILLEDKAANWVSVRADRYSFSSSSLNSHRLYPDPRQKLVVFAFYCGMNPGPSDKIMIMFSLECIQPYLEATTGGKQHIPWAEWGPRNTRILTIPHLTFDYSSDWSLSIFGTRFVTFGGGLGHYPTTSLGIYDFNPLRVRQARTNWSKTTGKWKLVDEEITLSPSKTPFKEDVTTSLSYRYAEIPLPTHFAKGHCWEPILTEDTVILRNKENGQQWSALSLSV